MCKYVNKTSSSTEIKFSWLWLNRQAPPYASFLYALCPCTFSTLVLVGKKQKKISYTKDGEQHLYLQLLMALEKLKNKSFAVFTTILEAFQKDLHLVSVWDLKKNQRHDFFVPSSRHIFGISWPRACAFRGKRAPNHCNEWTNHGK